MWIGFWRILKDRFVIFSLLGAAFFAWEALTRHDGSDTIIIGKGDIGMLEGRWQLQSGALPSQAELHSLIDHHVREEILVREALRLGLDKGDVIVRRRLAQKMEFLLRDLYDASGFTRSELEGYFSENSDRYVRQKQVGFRHIYLGAGPEPGQDEVTDMLADLASSEGGLRWRELGGAFMLAREFAPRPETAYFELFGPEFASRLMDETAPGEWLGPVRSAYGWHLVQVVVVEPRVQLSLDEAEERVAGDLEAERREAAVDTVLKEMAARYKITQAWSGE